MAQQVLMDGFPDAGTAGLALLLGEQIQLPLLLRLHPHADPYRENRETLCATA